MARTIDHRDQKSDIPFEDGWMDGCARTRDIVYYLHYRYVRNMHGSIDRIGCMVPGPLTDLFDR